MLVRDNLPHEGMLVIEMAEKRHSISRCLNTFGDTWRSLQPPNLRISTRRSGEQDRVYRYDKLIVSQMYQSEIDQPALVAVV